MKLWIALSFALCTFNLYSEDHTPSTTRSNTRTAAEVDLDIKSLAAKDLMLTNQRTDLAVGMMYLGKLYESTSKARRTQSPFLGQEEKIALQLSLVSSAAKNYQTAQPFDWSGAAGDVVKNTLSSVASGKPDPKGIAIDSGVDIAGRVYDANKEHISGRMTGKDGDYFGLFFKKDLQEFSTDPTNFANQENYRSFLKWAATDPNAKKLLAQLPKEYQDAVNGSFADKSPSVANYKNHREIDATKEEVSHLKSEIGKTRRATAEQSSKFNERLDNIDKTTAEMVSTLKDTDLAILKTQEMLAKNNEQIAAMKKSEEEQKKIDQKIQLIDSQARAAQATLGLLQKMAADDPNAQRTFRLLSAGVELTRAVSVMSALGNAAKNPAAYLNVYTAALTLGMELMNSAQSDGSQAAFKAIFKALQQIKEMLAALDKKLSGVRNDILNQSQDTRRQFEELEKRMSIEFDRIERVIRNQDMRTSERDRHAEELAISFHREYIIGRKHDGDVATEKYRHESDQAHSNLKSSPDAPSSAAGADYVNGEFSKNMNTLWLGATSLSMGPSFTGPKDSATAIEQFADSLLTSNDPGNFIGLVSRGLEDQGISIPVNHTSHDGKKTHGPVNLEFWSASANRFLNIANSHSKSFDSYMNKGEGLEKLKDIYDLGLAERHALAKIAPRTKGGKPLAANLIPLFAQYEEELNHFNEQHAAQLQSRITSDVNGYNPLTPPEQLKLKPSTNPSSLLNLDKGIPPCPGYRKSDKSGNALIMPSLKVYNPDDYVKMIPEIFLVAVDATENRGSIEICYDDEESTKKDRTLQTGRMLSLTIRAYFKDSRSSYIPIFSRKITTEGLQGQRASDYWNSFDLMERYLVTQNKEKATDLLSHEMEKKTLEAMAGYLKNHFGSKVQDALEIQKADLNSETGKLGIAMRRVESAKQMLGSALWLAYGDSAQSIPEISLAYEALPGRHSLSISPNIATAKAASNALLDTLLGGTTTSADGVKSYFTPGHSSIDDTLSKLEKVYKGKKLAFDKSHPGKPAAELNSKNNYALTDEALEDLEKTNEVLRGIRIQNPQMPAEELAAIKDALKFFTEKERADYKAGIRKVQPPSTSIPYGPGGKSQLTVDASVFDAAVRLQKAYETLHSSSEGPQFDIQRTRAYMKSYAGLELPTENELNRIKDLWKLHENDFAQEGDTVKTTPVSHEERRNRVGKFLPNLASTDQKNARGSERLAAMDKSHSEISAQVMSIKKGALLNPLEAKKKSMEEELKNAETLFERIRERQREMNATVKDFITHDFDYDYEHPRTHGRTITISQDRIYTFKWIQSDRREPKDCNGYDEDTHDYTPHKPTPRAYLSLRKEVCLLEKEAVHDTEHSDTKIYVRAEELWNAAKDVSRAFDRAVPNAGMDIPTIEQNLKTLNEKLSEIGSMVSTLHQLDDDQKKYHKSVAKNQKDIDALVKEWRAKSIKVEHIESKWGDRWSAAN